MNRVPYLDLEAQYHAFRTEVLSALEEICESSRFAQGPATSDFEAQFGSYCGVDHCVIEDAAQAHGAKYRGKRVGQFGRIACFSFYPSKNLGAYGEGGALITNDASIAHRARSLRDHAQSQKYFHDEIGYNYRMDSFQAAVLSIKLKHLDAWNAARVERASSYTKLLEGSSYKMPANVSDSECVWHCYVIETRQRDRVRSALQDAGIQTAVHYPLPIHRQKAYAHLEYKSGDLPVTEALCEHCLSLPIYPELSKEKISRVTSILLDLEKSLTLQA